MNPRDAVYRVNREECIPIPLSRIKTLQVKVYIAAEAAEAGYPAVVEKIERGRMIAKLGEAIAERLLEFDKVLIRRSDAGQHIVMQVKIQVIVPEAKPEASGI